jgi:hypothetical protein
VKIDIHIMDATPEEAARIVLASQRAEAATEAEKIKPESRLMKRFVTPDPLPGQTGCEGCPNTEFDAAKCEECSPPPAPIAAKLKAKHNPPEKPERRHRPTGRKPGPRPGTGKGNPYGIPTSLYTTDKKKYQRLWSRCKAKGIKYEEALAMDGKTKLVGRHAKKAKAEALIIKESAQSIASSNDVKEPVTVAAPSAIVIGAHVQQTRPDAGRMISGNGVVVGRRGEIVDVRDGGGKVHKILAACLKVVTTPVSDRATGMSS